MARKLSWQDPQGIQLIKQALLAGKAVVGTSDTVIGLLVLATKEGSQLLDSIKGRQNKPYIVLLDTLSQAKKYVDNDHLLQIEKLALVCWPGPITLIVKGRSDLPNGIRSKEGTIAVRIPDHGPLRELARLTGGLFSTSANTSGNPVPEKIDDLEPSILNNVVYIVDDRQHTQHMKASTIIDCTQEPFVVIREGAYAINKLKQIPGIRLEMKK